jgi:hypothetical protein
MAFLRQTSVLIKVSEFTFVLTRPTHEAYVKEILARLAIAAKFPSPNLIE